MKISKNNKLKQGVDLVFTSKSSESDYYDALSNLYGLVETGSDYNDLL